MNLLYKAAPSFVKFLKKRMLFIKIFEQGDKNDV